MPEDARHAQVEEEDDDIVLEDEDDDDEMMGNPLEDFLVSDEGDNVANVIAKGLERICQHLEVQNKIFVKMYSALSKIQPPSQA
jgi:hypothetical protein